MTIAYRNLLCRKTAEVLVEKAEPEFRPLEIATDSVDPDLANEESARKAIRMTPEESLAPQTISPQNAYLVRSMMMDVVRRGTGVRAMQLGRRDLAGKTGTTNEQRDAWFSGYNNHLVTSVWVGFDNHEPLGRRELGGRAALPVWMEYMAVALEGLEDQQPSMPEGLSQARIDPESGLLARLGNQDAIMEIFQAGRLPPMQEEEQGDNQRCPARRRPVRNLLTTGCTRYGWKSPPRLRGSSPPKGSRIIMQPRRKRLSGGESVNGWTCRVTLKLRMRCALTWNFTEDLPTRTTCTRLRQAAVAAMHWLDKFTPRLVGAVLDGTANEHSRAGLHIFADSTESVILHFLENGKPFSEEQRQIRWYDGKHRTVPLVIFEQDGSTMELTIFEQVHLRQSPPSPINGKPQRRASLAEAESLLTETHTAVPAWQTVNKAG